MKPDSFRFGGGGETYLHPVFACALVLVALLIFCLPRKYVVIPLFVAGVLIPVDQIIVIAGIHLQVARILIMLGWIRLLGTVFSSRVQVFTGGINAIDKAITLSVTFGALNFMLLWQRSAAFINQMGAVYTSLGAYFLLRFLIRDEEDIERVSRVFAYILAVIAIVMLFEHATGRNPYVIFGGSNERLRASLMERGDRFRAMASFTHPIQAGTFGAVLFPLFVGMWWKKNGSRFSAMLGMVTSTIVMIESVSSTPLMAYLAGILALAFWPLRDYMRIVRWGTVAALVSLHVVMKAPVWALIQRVDLIGGSSGYHRYSLVDQCIRHFGDWWLIGTKDYMLWGPETWDVSNQYVSLCESSGLLPFVFFVAILVYGFKYLGNARKLSGEDKRRQLFLWALGAALFSNCMAFIGATYSFQTMWPWYALLAIIPVACTASREEMLPKTRIQVLTSTPTKKVHQAAILRTRVPS